MISESSVSFHENELIQPPEPKPQAQTHFRGHGGHQGSSSSSSSVPAIIRAEPNIAGNQSAYAAYANRDSVRESWMSTGSSADHAHHVLHHPYHHHRNCQCYHPGCLFE